MRSRIAISDVKTRISNCLESTFATALAVVLSLVPRTFQARSSVKLWAKYCLDAESMLCDNVRIHRAQLILILEKLHGMTIGSG